MFIGFDAKRAFKNNTGLGNYSRMIINAVADARPDDEIVLFTPYSKGRYSHFWGDRANISVVTPTGLWRLFPGLWRTFGIARHLRRCGIPAAQSIYHGLSHELPFGNIGDTKLVVSMHDLIVWRYPKHFPFIDRLIYKAKQRYACRKADVIVAISKQTEADLVSLMGVDKEKIRVVYQSCDAIFREPVTDEQRRSVRERYRLPERYALCVGTIEKRKNQLAVVEAMADVDDDLHLVVIGKKTSYYETVAEAVRRLGLEHRVHFLQNVDFADFPALYSEAVLSVYMSIFEGFGIPVLESLTCGTPVIASNRSSIPEVGGDAALYANPVNPSEIANQIRKLLTDKDLYSTMSLRAKTQSALFTPDNIVSDLLSLYNVPTMT